MADTVQAHGIDNYQLTPAHRNSAAPPKLITGPKRSPIHPDDVQFSRAWLAASAFGALGTLGFVRKAGWRGLIAAATLAAASGAYITAVEPRRPVFERHTLYFPRLPAELDGLRVGHLSDSHLGMPLAAHNLRWAVAQLKREQPELIVFTGDFLHHAHTLEQLPRLLHGLSAPLGMYGVIGNHDSWEAQGQLKQVLQKVGFELLMNEQQRLTWRGGECWLLGTDDAWDGTPDLEASLHGVPSDAFTMLLAHTPHGITEAARLGIDLQLSGHTHGGHVALPLLGPLAKPRYTGKYIGGLYHVGPTTLYVSRGIGGAPIRLNCRPEVAVHTLRRGG